MLLWERYNQYSLTSENFFKSLHRMMLARWLHLNLIHNIYWNIYLNLSHSNCHAKKTVSSNYFSTPDLGTWDTSKSKAFFLCLYNRHLQATSDKIHYVNFLVSVCLKLLFSLHIWMIITMSTVSHFSMNVSQIGLICKAYAIELPCMVYGWHVCCIGLALGVSISPQCIP